VPGQIRQIETTTGTTLLRTSPGKPITLTSDGEQFARDALTAPGMIRAGLVRGNQDLA
jgi:DNA-binding transcriptional LysR family regulator